MSSSFLLLNTFHTELAKLAEKAEELIWSNPRMMLIQGRLFAEQLAIDVAKREKVEPVYPIKQIERIDKLEKNQLITPEIRASFEWLRIHGNIAVHEAKDTPIDIALTAHRQLYQLSAWYTELYGPIEVEAPDYVMPLPEAAAGNTAATDISETIKKLIEDQVSGKLLISIDDKFREMQEMLNKFASGVDEWARNTAASGNAAVAAEPVPAAIKSAEAEAEIEAKAKADAEELPDTKTDSDKAQQNSEIEIGQYMIDLSLDVVDKRENGGALWIIGGWELKDTLFALKPKGFNFRFARNGSQSTKRKPAWFLMGKDPSAKRWFIQETAETAEEENTLAAAESEEAASAPSAEAVQAIAEREAAPAIEQSELSEPFEQPEQDAVDAAGDRGDNGVIIPQAIRLHRLDSYEPSRLSEISQQLGIVTLEEWTEEQLKELYRQQPKHLHDVLVQLWFLGVEFRGELSRFIKLERESDEAYINGLKPDIVLEDVLRLDVSRLLARFGIRSTGQLNGIPVASIKWLLRGRTDDMLQTLEQFKPEEQPEESAIASVDEENAENADEQPLLLSFQEGLLEVPVQLLDTRIDDLSIQGCNALLTGIKRQYNIDLIRDLPVNLSDLTARISGVGQGAVQKFFVQLASFVNGGEAEGLSHSTVAPLSYLNQSAKESGKILWEDTTIELQNEDMDMPLSVELYPTVPKLIYELQSQHIYKLGELPTMLGNLQQINGVGRTVVNKFAAQLAIRLQAFRSGREQEQKWHSMSVSERIAFAIENLESLWLEKLSDEAIAGNRNLQMLHLRWTERKEGRRATLEWLGQRYELTRERVRQIISKLLTKLHPDVAVVERALKEACLQHQQYYCYPMAIDEKFSHGLLEQVVEEYEGLVYLEQYGWWTIEKQETFEADALKLRKSFQEWMRGRMVPIGQIEAIIPQLTEGAMPDELALRIVHEELQLTADSLYILANSKKYEMVEMVLRLYPEGVEIYKRANELVARANLVRPGEFVRERDFTSVFARDEFMDTAYLWGRGEYIHHSYVQVNPSLIAAVSDKALELLERRSPISVGRLFQLFEDELVQGGMPNEYALYTMLRKLGSDKLAPNKFPHIWHQDDAFQLSNGEQIKMFIRERQEPQKLDSLRDEFIVKRGWKKFTLEFSISTDSDFVSADLGIVGLREFYPYAENDFEPITKQLHALLDDTGVVHINRVYETTKQACDRMGIASGYLLYDLLQGLGLDRLRFARYPLISTDDHPLEGLTLQTMVEQYLAEQEAEVPRELVYHWVTEEVGARETTLDIALSNSDVIYYYRSGQFGEYIHRDRLGWSEEKKDCLVEYVSAQLSDKLAASQYFVTVDSVLDQTKLPPIESGLEWTHDLLIDCLRKSGKFKLFGSFGNIVAHANDSSIPSETDWIAHVLQLRFEGKAALKDLFSELAKLRYSKDGRFLYETLTKLEDGTAPFIVEDETVRSK
ncbi:sigma factor-like helix-turn-helix DNA-binding protein [Paenibacillus sp. NEAU-GSW1]|uniref:DUF4145 domain-containing protein n=1 Tax=Paenibacillus sp. NEAU-GSW1 TaxID=2682486 RepID=UPI0012E26EED|nr:sigma factor-like helix-turn-helix DNA-binding protein [Paenibacillus sp. NEAU-GSW1]MUT67841.1 DUF4145 domain-containing protein [Paenibacillus sp. NEAU-GSW1]